MTHVRYMDRTREYYSDRGYDKAYRWAHHDDVPFAPLGRPLAEARIGLLTTSELAVRFDPDTEDNPIVEAGFRSVYAIPGDLPVERYYSRTRSYDRHATHLDDVNAFFPVERLREALAAGTIGSLPGRFYGAYNNYSQRKVIDEEAPAVLAMAREDQIDAALLVPV